MGNTAILNWLAVLKTLANRLKSSALLNGKAINHREAATLLSNGYE
jgi:hypothetical protein